MNTRYSLRQFEDDGLQTDVMRFMAIIAFCLVAVLALVRDMDVTETPAPETNKSAATTEPEAAEPETQQPVVEVVMETQVLPAPMEALVESATAPPTPHKEIEVTKAAPKPAPNSTPEDQGLSLRFESDAAFINLIRKGKVRVYAFQQNQFLMLDRGFAFHPASPPQSIHELETVPSRVRAALAGKLISNQWGVRLPKPTAASIQHLANRFQSGQLVIDQTGAVRHVPLY